jgi:hypothetical protein
MGVIVEGGTKSNINITDASGKITISLWTFTNPNPQGHNDIQVNVGDEEGGGWVCIGGGGRGNGVPGNFLIASYPVGFPPEPDGGPATNDWKSWRVSSRDHVYSDVFALTGFAIGMRIEGLSRQELISNLSRNSSISNAASHPDQVCFVEPGYLLLGGGFDILDQPDGGGNLATASFPDSTISWRGRSKDESIISESRIRVFAIGIMPTIKTLDPTPNDPNHKKSWNIVTTFASFDSPGYMFPFLPESTVSPLPGFALCGGGAAIRPSDGSLLYDLEPELLAAVTPQTFPTQRFKGKGAMHMSNTHSTITAYAMGIKFEPMLTQPGTGTGTGPTCINPITVNIVATASGNQPTFLPANAVDNNLNTKWMSINTQNPYLRLDLSSPISICRLDIAWADPTTHYFFNISVSLDGTNFTYVFAGARIGSTIAPETYTFPTTQARYVKITINQSNPGTQNSLAQISEIKLFGP